MKILIIGGTGFIGSYLVSKLDDYDLTLLHRGNKIVEAGHARHIISDLTGLPALRDRIAKARYDVAVDMISSNGDEAKIVVGALSGVVEKVVVVSSGSVYRSFGRFLGTESGNIFNQAFRENDPLRSYLYPYSGHFPRYDFDPKVWLKNYDKILVEEVYRFALNLNSCIVRLPLVYGPADPDDRVGVYLKLMTRSKKILMDETTGFWRNSRSYVENVVAAMRLIIEEAKPGSIYNVSEPNDLSEKEWVEQIGRAAGWKGEVQLVMNGGIKALIDEFPKYANYHQHLLLDSYKIRSELNFSESVAVSCALNKTFTQWK